MTKLGPDGTYRWSWTFGGGPLSFGTNLTRALTVDGAGNILITGSFSDSVDFDPGITEDIHVSTGSWDIFATKLGSDGTYLWTRTFGGEYSDSGFAIASDLDDSVLLPGGFIGLVDFDPTRGEDWQLGPGDQDVFITKLHADGSYAWTATFGGPTTQQSNDVATDAEGNVFVTGYFANTVDFDPTDGEDIRTAVTGWWCDCSSRDIFLTKLGGDGSYLWTATIGDDTDDEAAALAVDGSGDVVLTGEFGNTVDFDPTDGVDIHETDFGGRDAYVTVLRGDGSYGWTVTLSGTQEVIAKVLALDPFGDIVVGGTFEGTVDFDPTEGVDEHTAIQYTDYFVTKLLCSDPLPCEGDANGDGSVDPLDAGFVLSRLGCAVNAGDPDCDKADMNGDNLVDPLDVGCILARFGTCE